MDKRAKTSGNKPRTQTNVGESAARAPTTPMPAPAPTNAQVLAALERRAEAERADSSASPTADIDQIITAIQSDITAARRVGDHDLSERLRGRLIQAERMRSKALDDIRKHELRLVDSVEWQQLSAKLARMVAGCDRCRAAVLTLLGGT